MCPSISIHVQFEILVHATLKGEVGAYIEMFIFQFVVFEIFPFGKCFD